MKNKICKLITKKMAFDEIGNQVETYEEREVFCEKFSLTSREFYSAATQGMKADIGLLIDAFDYDGEDLAEFGGKRYSIYRTFETKRDVEVYLKGV